MFFRSSFQRPDWQGAKRVGAGEGGMGFLQGKAEGWREDLFLAGLLWVPELFWFRKKFASSILAPGCRLMMQLQ